MSTIERNVSPFPMSLTFEWGSWGILYCYFEIKIKKKRCRFHASGNIPYNLNFSIADGCFEFWMLQNVKSFWKKKNLIDSFFICWTSVNYDIIHVLNLLIPSHKINVRMGLSSNLQVKVMQIAINAK